MKNQVLEDWQIYIISASRLNTDFTYISAPRVGLCANELKLHHSQVSTIGKGCQRDSGPGNMALTGFDGRRCAGAGGSHGGYGGHGGVNS